MRTILWTLMNSRKQTMHGIEQEVTPISCIRIGKPNYIIRRLNERLRPCWKRLAITEVGRLRVSRDVCLVDKAWQVAEKIDCFVCLTTRFQRSDIDSAPAFWWWPPQYV